VTRLRLKYLIDFVVIFLFVAILIRPLFRVKYMDLWGSIESTFIADGRFLRDNWIHPNWQPNWYCGTRTDYIYPPALRYGTALISKAVPKVLPVRAYHIYCAFFYCFGIAAVYLFVRLGSGSRMAGWIAAAAAALVSPSYLFNEAIRTETPWWLPYRLNVLVRYGEGPHMTAVAWIPLALLFSFRAMQQWRPVSLALAGVCAAMVVSNNFYGATSLALLFPVLAWSVYITHLDAWTWVRAAAIGVIAYGLTAFWLVPSYLQITLANMRFVSSPGNSWSVLVFLAVATGFVVFTNHFARGRRDRAYLVFVCGALAIFVTNVLGHYYVNFRIIGEPGRLYPELDLVFILFTVEMLRRFWPGAIWRKAAAAAIVLISLSTSYWYLQNSRRFFVLDPDPTDQVEYQMQDWMFRNMPQSRALTSGSVRFWYNAWHDLPQIGGGSEQGLLNPTVMPLQWEVLLGSSFNLSLWWLQLFGADAILVNEPSSTERYHDFKFPQKFKGRFEVAHDDGAGNIIYKVPRRYPSLARVVDRSRLDALPEVPGNGDEPSLSAWVNVIENGPDIPTQTRWFGTDAMQLQAKVREGQSVFVQVSFDENWRAYVDGKRVPIRRNKVGLMTIDAPPGTEEIRLEFPTPLANRIGYAMTVLTILSIGILLYCGIRYPSRDSIALA
jgi:hypothetical protein